MPEYHDEELLVLTKTYPNPSRSYRETVCVVAVNKNRELRRLYPIQFRFLSGDKQFKKWQWINAKISRSSDKRIESHNIDNDSIILGDVIKTHHDWSERLSWVESNIYPDFATLEYSRTSAGVSLGFIKPESVTLEVVKAKSSEWSPSQLQSLTKEGLFDLSINGSRQVVKKLPYDFYYQFLDSESKQDLRLLLTDWEVGALFWRCQSQYGIKWETKMREKLEIEFNKKNLHLLLGTVHRFPNQWLIVGLCYPPHLSSQLELPLGSADLQ